MRPGKATEGGQTVGGSAPSEKAGRAWLCPFVRYHVQGLWRVAAFGRFRVSVWNHLPDSRGPV